uniref:Uncharacterized protein n=1 Tax=Mastacembelus armatus TaxID=205130 RepID=A0A7N8YKU1_9TELE
MLALTKEASPTKCTTLAAIFPPILNDTRVPTFTPKAANYTCFVSSQSGTALGHLPVSWCGKNITVNATLLLSWARGDLYWFCGGGRLHVRLPSSWQGTCAMVRLGVPVALIGHINNASMFPLGLTQSIPEQLTQRRRRDVLLSGGRMPNFDLTQGSPTYIDAIGVPRGVPDEFKLADQVAKGFENLPIISAFFPVTPNKNVDRINYVHYNLLREDARDAIEGLSEQLGPTSLMTVQNRMALDMLLAEKGGVCSMFGGQCCTFIPNYTAPDGSVAKALARLRALSREMQQHSGINDPLEDWFSRTFGKWKTAIISVLLSLTGMVTALVLCGCCCIPCIRSLCHRRIVTAIEGQQVAHQLPLITPKGEAMEFEEEEDVTMAVQ